MFENNQWIALYFDAPLQSWGYQSRFRRRTTLGYPTKSGVIGLLGAALGIARNDRVQIASLVELEMTVVVLKPPKRLQDYHTVGGGYDPKVNPRAVSITAEGASSDPVPTNREYLMEAKFGVLLTGPDYLLQNIRNALKDPCWGIWFGRKSCVPAMPILQGVFPSETSALDHLVKISGGAVHKTIKDVKAFEEGTDSLQDLPIDFQARLYSVRRIVE